MDTNVFIDFLKINSLAITGGQTGQTIIFNGENAQLLVPGAVGTVLTSNGVGNLPTYQTVGAPLVPDPLNINRVNLNILGSNASNDISVAGRPRFNFNDSNMYYGFGSGGALYDTNVNLGNTGLGYQSFQQITIGSDNTGIGNNALRDLQSGLRNVAVGKDTVLSMTAGNDNVVLGFNALETISNISRNNQKYSFKTILLKLFLQNQSI